MSTKCNNPKNDNERSLCSCLKATEAMTEQIKTYDKDKLARASDQASWSRWNKEWYDWKYHKNNFSWLDTEKNKLANETKDWKNCVTEGKAWGNDGEQNKYCSDDVGEGWIHQTGVKSGNGCNSSLYKGVCKRSTDKVNVDLWTNHKSKAEPTTDPKDDSNKNWKGESKPSDLTFTSNNNIMCCSQIFSDIKSTSGNVKIENINQNCSQRINNSLNNTPSTTPTPTTPTPTTPSTTLSFWNNNKEAISMFIVVVVCSFLTMSGISAVLVLLNIES